MGTPSKRSRALAQLEDFTRAPRKSETQETLLYEALELDDVRNLLRGVGHDGAEKMSKAQATRQVKRYIKQGVLNINQLRKAAGHATREVEPERSEEDQEDEEEGEEEEEEEEGESKPAAAAAATASSSLSGSASASASASSSPPKKAIPSTTSSPKAKKAKIEEDEDEKPTTSTTITTTDEDVRPDANRGLFGRVGEYFKSWMG